MNFKVLSIPEFDKQTKRLSKKYPSLKSELIQSLSRNPTQGDPLGNHCFLVLKSEVYLLSIYDKSEKESISEKELKNLLSRILP